MDQQNRLWLITRSGVQMCQIPNDFTGKLKFKDVTDSSGFYSVYQDLEGTILMGGKSGLFELVERGDGFYLKLRSNKLGNVSSILNTKSKELLVATRKGFVLSKINW